MDGTRQKMVLRVLPRRPGCTIELRGAKRLVTFPLRSRRKVLRFIAEVARVSRLREWQKIARRQAKERTQQPDQMGLGLEET